MNNKIIYLSDKYNDKEFYLIITLKNCSVS